MRRAPRRRHYAGPNAGRGTPRTDHATQAALADVARGKQGGLQ